MDARRWTVRLLLLTASAAVAAGALILAALGTGPCRLRNLLHSDDTEFMLSAIAQRKGATYSWQDAGEVLVVEGTFISFHCPNSSQARYIILFFPVAWRTRG